MKSKQRRVYNVLFRGLSKTTRSFASVTLKPLPVQQVCRLLDHCNLTPLQAVVQPEGLTGGVLATSVNSDVDLTAVGLKPLQARALFKHNQQGKSDRLPADFCVNEQPFTPSVIQELRADFASARCDDHDALIRLRQAAHAGNHIAQGYIAVLHWHLYIDDENTNLEISNAEKALPQIKVDADHGCPYANYLVAVCLSAGKGIEKHPGEAFRRYKLAADVGNVDAICELGLCYLYGCGVQKDITLCIKYYKQAANLGDPAAQHHLACLYADGRVVQHNWQEARRYYELAAVQGYGAAREALDDMLAWGDPRDTYEEENE